MKCNTNNLEPVRQLTRLPVDVRSRRQLSNASWHLDTADMQEEAAGWLRHMCISLPTVLDMFCGQSVPVRNGAIRRAVDAQCTASLQIALANSTSNDKNKSAPTVQPKVMDKALRKQIVVAIGRAAAADDVAMLAIFVHHGFVSRTWMGPFAMDCAASSGCLTALAFMVTQAAASFQDAQEALYARRQPEAKSKDDCIFELRKAMVGKVDPRLFSIE